MLKALKCDRIVSPDFRLNILTMLCAEFFLQAFAGSMYYILSTYFYVGVGQQELIQRSLTVGTVGTIALLVFLQFVDESVGLPYTDTIAVAQSKKMGYAMNICVLLLVVRIIAETLKTEQLGIQLVLATVAGITFFIGYVFQDIKKNGVKTLPGVAFCIATQSLVQMLTFPYILQWLIQAEAIIIIPKTSL